MIYIISGASRSGKSSVGKKLFKKLNITYIEVDDIMMAFYKGMPETKVHPENWPDVTAKMIEPFLHGMITTMIENKKDAVFEGEQFLPEYIRSLLDTYPDDVKACFLGFTEITLEEKYNNCINYAEPEDWLIHKTKEYIKNHVLNMKNYSKKIKQECIEHNVPYVDTSHNFKETLDEIIEYLLKKEDD